MIIVILVALNLLTACAQTSWKYYNDAGFEAKEQARYAEAEEFFLAGLEEAKKFEDLDPRIGTSLNNLAEIYRLQGKYAEAKPLVPASRSHLGGSPGARAS